MHSLVSSQGMALCRWGNWPKTKVLFCRYVGGFRSLNWPELGRSRHFLWAGSCSSLLKPMSFLGVSKSNLMLVSISSCLGLLGCFCSPDRSAGWAHLLLSIFLSKPCLGFAERPLTMIRVQEKWCSVKLWLGKLHRLADVQQESEWDKQHGLGRISQDLCLESGRMIY